MVLPYNNASKRCRWNDSVDPDLTAHLGLNCLPSLSVNSFFYIFLMWQFLNTPGNVVRGSQSHANKILTGASSHDLQTIHTMSTNVLSCYSLISQKENRHLGNVFLNSFHFYARLNRNSHGKTSSKLLIFYLKQIYPTTPRSGYIKLKINRLSFHVHTYFVWCRNESIQNHNVQIPKNLAAKMFKN